MEDPILKEFFRKHLFSVMKKKIRSQNILKKNSPKLKNWIYKKMVAWEEDKEDEERQDN